MSENKSFSFAKKPCANCPFKKNSHPFLSSKRAEEISRGDNFQCHKTLKPKNNVKIQCAGHVLLRKHGNLPFRLQAMFGEEPNISGRDEVFDTMDDFLNNTKG